MTIKQKLFLITILPISIITFLSFDFVLNNYNNIKTHKKLLKSVYLLKSISDLLHQTQYERGLSTSFSNTKNIIFKDKLQKQYIKTDLYIKNFTKIYKQLNTKELKDIYKKTFLSSSLQSIPHIRKSIKELIFSANDSFLFYSKLNHKLLRLSQGIELYSSNKKVYKNIKTIQLLTSFREYAGKERALVSMLIKKDISTYAITQYHNAINSQYLILEELRDKVKIYDNNNYLLKIRKQIIERINTQDINIEQWIKISTQRIDTYHDMETSILISTEKDLKNIIDQLYKKLFILIAIVSFIIIFLFLSLSLVSRNIVKSLQSLDKGINDFFDYLNFKTDKSKNIQLNSNDELNDIAQKINKQIKYLKLNLQNDKDFIKETTQVAQLMKDGNFTKHIYFEPANPSLAELKIVFNELIHLITNKIKEQTQELEIQKAILEDEVYYQNVELEQQVVDITASRDEVLEAQKAKDDFLAIMSHEIRTPLNAILGFVTILQKRLKDEKNIKYLNIIDNSGNSLLAIINDILDFSKIQSGKFTISPRDIDPMVEFSNTTLLFASKSYEKHLIYAVYIDPNLPKYISVDDTRIKQILSNLLSNAIKFTPIDGMIKVQVLIKNNNLIISVQDSGIGIAEKNIDKIFSAFEQADSSTTRKYGGTGLGLSISSKLANLMDGTLEVTSKENQGSTFTLTVPIKIVNHSAKQLVDINKVTKYKFAILHKSKDDEIFTRLIKKYLQDLNITHIIELKEYQSHGYDILFFIPDDEYNEDIIEADAPAIAMLRSTQVKLANISNITSLYAPFTPVSIIQAIDEITIENLQSIDESISIKKEDEDVTYTGKVLVAEDNKTNQMLIGLLLSEYEIEYKIANNGLDAVKIFKEDTFDLVLMDENMPELNGLGAMKKIKEYEKENSLKKTPIVALTAAVLQNDVQRFLAEGMDGFVAKPIDNKQLELELDKYLKRN